MPDSTDNPVLTILRTRCAIVYVRATSVDAAQQSPVGPPILEWMFESPSPQLYSVVERAFGSFRGRVAWEFGASEGRWYLQPARIREIQVTQPIPLASIAAAKLAKEEPEFVRDALADLSDLAAHLEGCFIEMAPSSVETHHGGTPN